MGTPDFAVPSLSLLLEKNYNVVAVITTPDKPQGRGQKINFSPIKKKALAHRLPILQPIDLEDPSFIQSLRDYKADLYIVVAFRILPKVVWSMPPKGTFNLHASLLPQYRGAAPIHWAIINGEKKTGLTTFFLDDRVDTGKILLQEEISIPEHIVCGDLYNIMCIQGANLVLKTTTLIQKNKYNAYIQPDLYPLKKAPKIYRKNCIINWYNSADSVYNFIRGLSPHPGAYTILKKKEVKILEAEKVDSTMVKKIKPGAVHTDYKNYIYVGTNTFPIAIIKLQMPGKKIISVKNFLLGNKLI